MPKLNNLFEIYKLLDKSNCRKCNEKTCMAFAGKAYLGEKQLGDCPSLEPSIVEQYSGNIAGHKTPDQMMEKEAEQLKEEIHNLNLAELAEKVGGVFADGKLSIQTLGKDYQIYPNGDIKSDIHMNPWILGPLMKYLVGSDKAPLTGKWVLFRELEGGEPRYALFRRRCEEVLKKIADSYTQLFEDMIHVFSGKQVQNHNKSDISLVLHPLPKLPVLISYWKPDGDFESDFVFCFDSSAGENLHVDYIFTICTGIAMMLQKLSIKHN